MFRLAIFVDGAYLDKVAKKKTVWVDYEKLASEILTRVNARTPAAPMDLLRTYYYNDLPHQSNPPLTMRKHTSGNAVSSTTL